MDPAQDPDQAPGLIWARVWIGPSPRLGLAWAPGGYAGALGGWDLGVVYGYSHICFRFRSMVVGASASPEASTLKHGSTVNCNPTARILLLIGMACYKIPVSYKCQFAIQPHASERLDQYMKVRRRFARVWA